MSKYPPYTVLIQPKGSISITPNVSNASMNDDIKPFVDHLRELLFEFSNKPNECWKQLDAIYKTLPKTQDYYFMVEKHYDSEDQPLRRACYSIGPGKDVVDALSTYLMDPHIGVSKDGVRSTKGHFVRAYFIGEKLEFDRATELDYKATMRLAHIESRKKLKRITVSMPNRDQVVPAEIAYSLDWTRIGEKYSKEIESMGGKSTWDMLNSEFQLAEKTFYRSVKHFQELHRKQQAAMANAAVIGLILQGASILADMSAKNSYSEELSTILEQDRILMKEVGQAYNKAYENLNRLNSENMRLKNFIKQHHMSMNDDRQIDDQWKGWIDSPVW